jgi:hypothetical protein
MRFDYIDMERIFAIGIVICLTNIATLVVCDGPDWLAVTWLVGLGVMYYEWMGSFL